MFEQVIGVGLQSLSVLLKSVTCLNLKNAEGYDLEHFANVAHLLIQDGCDALDALGWKLKRVSPTAA